MPVRRPLLAIATALALAASGLSAGAAASAAPAVTPAPNGYTPAGVEWKKCDPDDFPKNFQCGSVAVPLDWNDVGGTKITLALTRVVHTAKHYQGVMLVNPGGPGGSGLGFAGLGEAVPHNGGDGYDWIGFDPRGVGASEPALTCDPDSVKGPRPAYEPTTKAIEREWIARSKSYAADCGAKNGALLAQMTTDATAKDMDAIRVALGQEQINYYGFSYGTYLGQVYATLFPSHLRRVVFDGTVDPTKVWYQGNLDQNVAFQKDIDVFFAWIARYDRVYHLGTTGAAVAKRYYAVQAALDRKPVGDIGGDELNDSVLVAGYVQVVWPDIARNLSRYAVNGSTKALRELWESFGEQTDDNGFAVYTAVQCNESQWPATYASYRADATRIARVAPFVTWNNTWFNAACLYWPLPRTSPVQIDGSQAPAILMINETLDGATPYAGSLEVRRRFPKAVLIAEPGGTSHANSLAGNACVDDRIAKYLKHGTLPTRKAGGGADVSCAPLPKPRPASGSSAGAGGGSVRGALAVLRGALR